ncbi:hypothetical protein L228DRAFT_132935 [Xylona heveae TC161]|uniref:25S rRNA (uridine-N(3))-methyltransferase BMT5-like domain-containing protein n=1 Tax=Xylona heveae (strain CBS 132557 / TC161) TaxID=1328760 RepID=A0A165GVV9_XYLHT|nr:hypothetical protein L228DRAFT_132935 [Xylona heveae TC161]KZF22661.1 hypothetical protein L228DRAFT_132935 [Xylona heveae TC161]
MAKSHKKRNLGSQAQRPKGSKTPPSKAGKAGSTSSTTSANISQRSPLKPTIPFSPEDRILLIGEGDFSFALSIQTHHFVEVLAATSYEPSAEAVCDKYPQAASHTAELEAGGATVLYGVDARKLGKRKEIRKPSSHGNEDNSQGAWDRIIWNFPHTGGVTKDVNRQVRANQELLVAFFKAAMPLLRSEGTIIVTLFEGDPYTLWNIRDLARHVGLSVARSFKFQADAYPGYKHARTLGNIEGGGGWKGESRSARSYIFQLSDSNGAQRSTIPKRKRKKGDDASSDEDV